MAKIGRRTTGEMIPSNRLPSRGNSVSRIGRSWLTVVPFQAAIVWMALAACAAHIWPAGSKLWPILRTHKHESGLRTYPRLQGLRGSGPRRQVRAVVWHHNAGAVAPEVFRNSSILRFLQLAFFRKSC